MQIRQIPQSEPKPPAVETPGWQSRIDVLSSLRLHKLAATLIVLATIGLGAALVLRHRPSYEAASAVYVSPNFHPTLAANQEQVYPYDSYVEEQVHSVTSYNIVADAVRRLPPGVWQFPEEPLESAVARLQQSLTVKRDGQSYQVLITLTGPNPAHLAEIVNAVTDSYLEGVKSEEFYGRDERLDSLRQARTEVQKELSAKLLEQTQISQLLGVAVITSDGSDQIDTQVAKLRGDLTVAHEQRITAEAQLNALMNGGSTAPSAALNTAADEMIASDPSLLALKSTLSTKRAVLLDQLGGMTANHPLRKTTEEQLAQIETSLQAMQTRLRNQAAANLQQKLRTDLRRASMVESTLLGDLQSNTYQAKHAASSFQRAQVLKSEIGTLQARYATLDERTRNLELESKSPGSVHMFSPARTPTAPLPSAARFILPLLVPFALVMATVGVMMIDLFDRRVHSGADVEQILGFAPIGAMFNDREVTMQIFDECTLRLAAGIDQAARTSGVRTIVLSSVTGGAGTTSITQQLGNMLAKLGRKTLTIDSTGATPPVAYVTMNQAAHRGIGNPFTRQDSKIWPTAVFTQPFAAKVTPLNNFMEKGFQDLTTGYDIVLIDAAPLLISAETEYLSRFADVTMLIAEAGKTTKAQLMRASRLLERLQIPGMAIIVNKMAFHRANRAMREDLSAFEARAEKGGSGSVRWNAAWNKETASKATTNMGTASREHSGHERAGKKSSTYA